MGLRGAIVPPRGRRAAGLCLVAMLAALALVPRQAGAATDYLPGQDWLTYDEGEFRIHFTETGRPWAERVAAIAREAFPILREWTAFRPRGPIHVVVIADNDFANGSATPLPRNTVRLYPVEPRHPSFLQEYGDWLALLFVHELLHIFHLDMHAMPATIFRKLFGRQVLYSAIRPSAGDIPLYFGFPNALLPDTLIEGYAVWTEGVHGGGMGRANGPQSLSLRRNAAREGSLPSLGEAVGLRRDYPGGNGPRIYGGAFHAYVAEQMELSWTQLYRLYSRGVLPYLWGLAALPAFDGQRPAALWSGWAERERFFADRFDAGQQTLNEGTRVAGPYLSARSPRFDAAGRVVVSVSDGREHDRVVRLDASWETLLAKRHGGSGLTFAPDGSIVFDGNRRWRDTAVVSRLQQPRRHRNRLLGPPHAFEPDIRGDRIVWVRRDGAAYCIELASWPDLDLVDRLCADSFRTLHDPVLSPDGSAVAFVEWRPGSRHDVLLWAPGQATASELSVSVGDETLPRWSDDGRAVYFVSTRTGAPELYHVDVSDPVWWQDTRTSTGVWQFDLAGTDVVYLAPGGEGWSVYRATLTASPVSDAAMTAIPDPRAFVETMPTTEPTIALDAAPYRAIRTLAPTGWTPALELGKGRQGAAGFQIGTQDVLARWSWGTLFLLRWNENLDWHGLPDVDYGIGYNQGRWYLDGSGDVRPVNRLEVFDDQVAVVRRYAERHELGVARVFRQIDMAHALRLHAAEEHLVGGTKSIFEAGFSVLHDSRKSYAWSLVPGDGVFVKLLAAGNDGRQWRSDGRAELVAATGGFLFRRMQWQLQGAAGLDLRQGGSIAYSLHGPNASSFSARHFTGRGVPATDATLQDGERCPEAELCRVDRFGLWELEALWPLWWIQAGPGAAPFFFDQLHLRTFVAGAHFRRYTPVHRDFDQQLYAGAEIQLGLIFGWNVPLGPLTFGARWPLLSSRTARPDTYLYYGLSFDGFGSFLVNAPVEAESF